MDFVKLTEEKLDIGKISEDVTCSSTGAVSIFVGTTRDNFDGKEVVKLEYEAYDGMAEKEMKKLCGEIREKWLVENIAIYHRLGEVPAKEASVVIAISSEHRRESLQAVQWAIDTLKARVPIWKKEIYKEGQGEWKANKECKTEEKKAEDVNLIQVNASNEEIERRIAAFVERKRLENDITNVREFCSRFSVHDPAANSCARTDAVLVSRKDSKSHLRISRVVNTSGPQTSGSDRLPIKRELLPKVDKIISPESSLPSAIEERLKCIEESSGISLREGKPIPKHIYERLKRLEDRLLYLESLSPEYFNGDWVQATSRGHEKRKAISVSDLDNRMANLKKMLRSKQELQE